jgi:hypothetical protein
MKNGKACCLVGDSCCNDTSKYFDFKPGYIQAVINGDGTNRLAQYIPADGSSAAANSTPSSSAESSMSTAMAAAAGETGSSTAEKTCPGTNKPAIALGVVLGALIPAALAGLVFFWLQYVRERKARLEAEAANLQYVAAYRSRAEEELHVPAAELFGSEITELPLKSPQP